MKLVNLTPHEVTILAGEATPFVILGPSGVVARCSVTSRQLDPLFGVIPVATSELGEVTGLPEQEDGIALVVSRIVAEALPERSDLYFPGEVVRDEKGNIVACRGLCRAVQR
jgi:hypothetical protein